MTARALPRRLAYLKPVLESLAALPPEELNEDTDMTELEAALRDRIAGLSAGRAQRRLDEDRAALQACLEGTKPEGGPEFFVLGYLMHPGLAECLLSPPEPVPPRPLALYEPPAGFPTKPCPGGVQFNKGRLMGFVEAPGPFLLEFRRNVAATAPAAVDHPVLGYDRQHETTVPVTIGPARGFKTTRTLFADDGSVANKGVDYLLEVPGGHVLVVLQDLEGDFDETVFEAQFHTLRVQPVNS